MDTREFARYMLEEIRNIKKVKVMEKDAINMHLESKRFPTVTG